MRFRTYPAQYTSCRSAGIGAFGSPGSRFVFLDGGKSKEEIERDKVARRVEDAQMREKEAFYEEKDLGDLEKIKQTVDYERLGVTKKVWNAIKGDHPALVILAHRIRTRFERMETELKEEETEDRNFVVGAMTRVKDAVSRRGSRVLGYKHDVAERVVQKLGSENNLAEMMESLTRNVKSLLDSITTPNGLEMVMEALTSQKPTATPTVDEVLKAMEKATPSKLARLKQLPIHDKKGENPFAANEDFETLILFRKVAVEETMNMLSLEHYDSEDPMHFWHKLQNGSEGAAAEKQRKEAAEEVRRVAREKCDERIKKAEEVFEAEYKRIGDAVNAGTKPEADAKNEIQAARNAFEAEEMKAQYMVTLGEERAEWLLKARPTDISAAEKESYRIITQEILQPDTLYSLSKPDPTNLKLQQKLRRIYKERGPFGLKKLMEELLAGQDSAPEVATPEVPKPKSLEQRETINAKKEILFNPENYKKLRQLYIKLEPAKNAVDKAQLAVTQWQAELAKFPAIITDRFDKERSERVSQRLDAAQRTLAEAEKNRDHLLGDVIGIESDITSAMGKILTIFEEHKIPMGEKSELKFLLDHLTKIEKSPTSASNYLNTVFSQFLGEFTTNHQEKLKDEIEAADALLNPRVKITPLQLLTRLNQMELIEDGLPNPELSQQAAILMTNADVAEIEELDTHRFANREIAEFVRGGARGWAHRKYELFAKNFFSSEVFGAEEVLEHVVGLHPKFKSLEGIHKYSTLADLRKAINGNGTRMSRADIREFRLILKGILEKRQIREGKLVKKIKIFDQDWDVADLIRNLRLLEGEVAGLDITDEVLNPKDEADKLLTTDQRFLKLVERQNQVAKEEEKTILERVGESLKTFSARIVGKIWGPQINEAYEAYRQDLAAGKTDLNFRDYAVEQRGIPETIMKLFANILALKEVYDVTKAGAQAIGGALSSGAGAVKGVMKSTKAPSNAAVVAKPAQEGLIKYVLNGPFRLAGFFWNKVKGATKRAKAWNDQENARARAKIAARKAGKPTPQLTAKPEGDKEPPKPA